MKSPFCSYSVALKAHFHLQNGKHVQQQSEDMQYTNQGMKICNGILPGVLKEDTFFLWIVKLTGIMGTIVHKRSW